ncbi:MAG: hypothetical protein FJ009_14905 [Chloroflexi bacterium]|nr:hypothetical protein [Chloroflexota bacterium]
MSALQSAIDLMEIAARTAPKGAGKDFVVVKVIEGDDLKRLGDAMIAYGQKTGKKNFDRDGRNVAASEAVMFIGLKNAQSVDLNCGACGVDLCNDRIVAEHTEFAGAQCAIRVLDMGIALGSAVKTASLLNVDNRIMYRAGVVARQLGIVDADFVMGIPLSVTGKSIYFDR